jgi:hypothetical protein
MQERANEHWRKMAQRKHEPEPMDDFGWHNPEPYALEIGAAFAQFHILPEVGGWANQYEADKHDIATYMAGYGRAVWEEYQDDDAPGASPAAPARAFPDWTDYT